MRKQAKQAARQAALNSIDQARAEVYAINKLMRGWGRIQMAAFDQSMCAKYGSPEAKAAADHAAAMARKRKLLEDAAVAKKERQARLRAETAALKAEVKAMSTPRSRAKSRGSRKRAKAGVKKPVADAAASPSPPSTDTPSDAPAAARSSSSSPSAVFVAQEGSASTTTPSSSVADRKVASLLAV